MKLILSGCVTLCIQFIIHMSVDNSVLENINILYFLYSLIEDNAFDSYNSLVYVMVWAGARGLNICVTYVIHFRGSEFPEYNNTNVMQLNKMD